MLGQGDRAVGADPDGVFGSYPKTCLCIDGANCPFCFNETLDDLAHIEGVRAVRGSIAGPCIELDHDDVALDTITGTVRNRLHGVEMFSNEIRMTRLDPVAISACTHQQPSFLGS